MGIEPTRSAWKAEVLPLNYICIFSSLCSISYLRGFVKHNKNLIVVSVYDYSLMGSLYDFACMIADRSETDIL